MNNEIKNALIESVEICNDDRGFLDCWLSLSYGGSGQGFGGYALYLPKSFKNHKLESLAGHHIHRCMEVAGVGKWSEMRGKTIRVRVVDGLIHAIGHIVNDDWYSPREDFKSTEQ